MSVSSVIRNMKWGDTSLDWETITMKLKVGDWSSLRAHVRTCARRRVTPTRARAKEPAHSGAQARAREQQQQIPNLPHPKLLLIGPLPQPENGKIGGARVSFQQLVDFAEENEINYTLLETQPMNGPMAFVFNPLRMLLLLLWRLPSVDTVWMNVSQKGTRWLAPLVATWCRWFNKRFVFRPFGSALLDEYPRYPAWQRNWFKQRVLRADLVFWQTHAMLDFFAPLTQRQVYLPTSRPDPGLSKNKKGYQRRFVYLGHIKPSKGIEELLAAAEALGETFILHLYGPLKDAAYQHWATDPPSCYKGVLETEEVPSILQMYDVLLLPSYFAGEGYSGAVIEAFAASLPVIATDWRALPEIVIPDKTGWLIAPYSSEALVKCIKSIDKQSVERLSLSARQYFVDHFSTQQVLKRAFDEVLSL